MDPVEPWEEKQEVIKLTAPVEIGMRMNARQLEKYQATLEGLLHEVLPSSLNASDRPLRGEGGQNLDTPTQRGPRNVHGSSTGFGRKTPSFLSPFPDVSGPAAVSKRCALSEMQGDVFGLRATFMEVTEFVRKGSACLHFLAVLSGNPGTA